MPGPFYFAWAGGAIADQQTVVTTGNVHGGVLETLFFVGDIEAGSQIMRLAVPGKLQENRYYQIDGPGVAAVTIYDSSISAPGSLTLFGAAAGAGHSTTYTATAATVLGRALVTFTANSDAVAVVDPGGIDLVAGVYMISGFPIGDAGDKPVSAAYLDWTGSAGTMFVIVVLADGVSIEGRPVTALASGDFLAEISGTPTSDWYTVNSIPSPALSGLTEGAIYNISGNGIPAGSSFVAPASGATSITLDQPGSASVAGALLTITGPRTPDGPWDPELHARFDEDVLTVEISQAEGDFATLNITLKNPGLGLLAAGRNLWCWLSWDQAWTPEGGASPDIVPLINGRLVGVPRLTAAETVELSFLARPDDFITQKLAVAAGLQVLPYWDPVWLSADVGPDTVLETYSALWHIDRVTLALSTSDVIQGEAGTVTIGEDKALYDRFSLSYGQPPLTSVAVSGTVNWQQQATGIIDLTQTILDAFRDQAGAPYGRTLAATHPSDFYSKYSAGGLIQVLSGDGLLNAWPKAGSSIGAGWSFPNLSDASGVPLNYIIDASDVNKGGWFDEMHFDVQYAALVNEPPDNPFGGGGDYLPYNDKVMQVLNKGKLVQVQVSFPTHTLKFRMMAEYKADRRRTETVHAVMVADVQRQLSDSADQDREEVSLSSDYVGQGVDVGGGVPIGDLAYRSYFQTDRGARSLEYLFLVGRAKLRARARSVDVTFAVDWRTALDITLRHSVTLLDRRLPGGTCTGKVKSYTLSCKDGVMLGEFTLGCSIGNGTVSTAATGEPTYVEDGYVEPGYQVMAGGQYPLLADEFAYETLDAFPIDDDGVNLSNLTRESAVNYCTVVNGMLTQVQELSRFQGTVAPSQGGDPLTSMRDMMTTVTLDLVPLQGSEFHTDFFPSLTQLSLPKTIDLSAAE